MREREDRCRTQSTVACYLAGGEYKDTEGTLVCSDFILQLTFESRSKI